MLNNAACLGSEHLLLSDEGFKALVQDYCPTCPVIRDCAEFGLEEVYVNDNGKPFSWLVYGGMYPIEIESLWMEGDLICVECFETVHPLDWNIDGKTCKGCA